MLSCSQALVTSILTNESWMSLLVFRSSQKVCSFRILDNLEANTTGPVMESAKEGWTLNVLIQIL